MNEKGLLKAGFKIALLLALLVSIASCQGSDLFAGSTATPQPTHIPTRASTATPATKATLEAELQVSPAALSGTELTFWHPLNGNSAEVLNQLVNEFNQMNPYGIFVTPTNYESESELSKALDGIAQSNAPLPSVVAAPLDLINHWNGAAGEFVDLLPYIHQPGTGFTAQEISDFFPSFFPQSLSEEEVLGLPAFRTGNVLFYNQTWAGELGFTSPPSTPEEFKAQACSAAKANSDDKLRSNDGTGGWYVDTSWPSAVSWLNGFGFDLFPTGADGKFSFSNPQTEDAFTYLRQLWDQGCAWSGKQATPYEYFATRQALFYSGDLQDIGTQKKTNERLGSKDDWIPIPYPSESGNEGVLATGLDYAMLTGDAKTQMASWLFIKWLMDPARHARLAAADTTFPLSYSEIAALSTLGEENPQWQQALGFVAKSRSAPQSQDWWMVRQILEDALWKSLQPNVTVAEIPTLLHELDATIAEVLNH